MRKPSILALTLLTSACSLIPPLDPVASPVSDHYAGKSGGVVSADIAWQKFFTDPRLKKLVETALANNRDLRIATLTVEQSRAQYGISRSELFPELNITGSSERRRSVRNDSNGSTVS